MPEGRRHHRTSGAGRRGRKRHWRRTEDAGSETETIRHVRREKNRMKKGLRKCRAVGSEENQKTGFPPLPTSPWKSPRDSHIPAAPTATRVEKWKSKGRITTFPRSFFLTQTKNKKGDQSAA